MFRPFQPGAVGTRPDDHQTHGAVAVPNYDYREAQLAAQSLVYHHVRRTEPVKSHYVQREELEARFVQVRYLFVANTVGFHDSGQLVESPQAAGGSRPLLCLSVLAPLGWLPQTNFVVLAPPPHPVVHLLVAEGLAVVAFELPGVLLYEVLGQEAVGEERSVSLMVERLGFWRVEQVPLVRGTSA